MMKIVFFIFYLTASLFSRSFCQSKSHFVGTVVAEWLESKGDYRDMKLVKDFGFVDSSKKVWSVPAGAVVNGASIPRMLWALVGSPYTGAYRDASVVHDHYCDTKTESWKAVHRMFYEACLTGGTLEIQAKIMYAAVYCEGPRWELKRVKNTGPTQSEYVYMKVPIEVTYPEKQFPQIQKWIETENPSLEDIEAKMDRRIKEKLLVKE